MGIGLVKTADAAARVPSRADEKTLYIDLDGVLKVKGSDGIPLPAIGGNVIPLVASGSDPAPLADAVKIYCKLVEGVPTLFTIDDEGTVAEVGAGGASSNIRWKDDVAGDPFGDGDSVVANFGDVIMFSIADGFSITITLPAITPQSAGQKIGLRNLVNLKAETAGLYLITPNAADSLQYFATGESASASLSSITLESDGVGRWNVSEIGDAGALSPEIF